MRPVTMCPLSKGPRLAFLSPKLSLLGGQEGSLLILWTTLVTNLLGHPFSLSCVLLSARFMLFTLDCLSGLLLLLKGWAVACWASCGVDGN